VADGRDGLRIIDVSDPSNPSEIGFYDTDDYAYGVFVTGSYAYMADRRDGLRIIDISDPTAPTEVGFFDTGDLAYDVYVSDNYVYIADAGDGLYVLQPILDDATYIFENREESLSDNFDIRSIYPNPFNPVTRISYDVLKGSFVSLRVYDLQGRIIETLVNEYEKTGRYTVTWSGATHSSGLYLVVLEAPGYRAVKKCMLIK